MSFMAGRTMMFTRPRGIMLTGMIISLAASIAGYFVTREWLVLAIPAGLMALIWGLQDFRWIYLAIWATLPFAIEVDLPGGLSTDFPIEPLMWLTCLMFPVYLFLRHKEIDFRFLFHPILLILMFHFFWIVLTSILSQEPLISLKYTLAKSWYLLCFIIIPLILFKEIKDFKVWALVVFIPLILSVIVILVRHSQYGFSFSTINSAVIPIYRNHVDYACCLGIVLPYVWFIRKWFEQKWIRMFFIAALLLLLTGIYFSYTRAAWLCVPIGLMSYFFIRLKLMRVAIPVALAAGILIVGWLAYDNHYISYSPNYEKTITHKKFDDLVSATYKMEDISTVERFYRWVAGYYMVQERPWTGFGPASFYNTYHTYVDRHFTTYVSDNPEHSGIHNYYLMVAVEQGLVGLAIFLLLLIAVICIGENVYHRMEPGPKKDLILAALISFICNLFILTLNDTVETDKLGTFFFMSIAIVIFMSLQKIQHPGSKIKTD